LGSYPNFSGIPPTLAPTVAQPKKKLTMPPQKKSKKNAPVQANQDDHLPTQGNETSFVPESSNVTDQQRREKLEALMKARAEKQLTSKNNLLSSKSTRMLMLMMSP
jgi:hypothetical protein